MKTKQLQNNIPSDWQTIKLAKVFDFKNGLNKEKKYFGKGTPIVNYVDVYNGGGLFQDSIKGLVEVSKSEKERFEVRKGDVFFTRTSETLSEIGFSAVVLEDFKETVFSGFVLRARPKGNLLSPHYAKYCFKTQQARQEIKEKSSYTTRALTSGSLLNHVNISLPPLPEQNRIVSVLETWDKAIEKISKKIEIKKQIKKGLMQDLLTGKKRLKGFSDKWEVIPFDNCISNIGDGGTPDRKKTEYFGGDIPWVVIGDIKSKIYKTEEYLTELGLKKSSAKLWKKGSIILSTGATIGNVGVAMIEVCTKQGITGIEIKDTSSNIFIYYWLLTQKNKLISIGHGGTFKDIRPDSIKKLQILIPKSKEEQEAIAQILTTADDEITELEKKLQIIEDQKKYLLNNLITGTIRTPETLSTKLTK